MGRGKDLTNNERTTVHSLLKKNWNYEQNWEKITDIWACYFNNLRGIMSVDGSNDYKQAHNNSRNLIKTTGTPIDLRVDLEDYDRCFDLLNDV